MRYHLLWFAAISFLGFALPLDAQVPARYRAIAGGRIRLERILGTPEVQAGFASVAISAHGKRMVSVEDLSFGIGDKRVARSRLLVGAPQSMSWPREIDLPGKQVTALALSANGGKVLLGGLAHFDKEKADGCFLSLWDLNKGIEIKTIRIGEDPMSEFVGNLALAEDEGSALVRTDSIKRWNLKTGKLLESYSLDDKVKRQPGPIAYLPTAIASLPGGKQFLAKMPGEILLFDLDVPKSVRTYRQEGGDFFQGRLAPSADGKRFASGDASASSATLWDTASGKEINVFHPEKSHFLDFVSDLSLAGDNKTVLLTLASFNSDADFVSAKLCAWDGETNKILWSHVVPYRGRVPMRVIGDKLLIGGGPNLVEVWDWKQGKKLQTWGGHKGAVNAVNALQDGSMLSAGQDGALLKWRDGLLVGRTAAHQGAVVGLAVSGDKKHWLTAGTDQTVKLWRDQDAKPMQTLKGHAGSITSLVFDHTGKIAVTGSGDRTAKTWDLATGKEIASFAGHSEGVNAVALSPDNRWLATGSDDTTIRVWPIKDGKADPSREAIVLEKHTKPVTCLQFTPDGKTLLSGSQDQKLMAWNWRKGSMDFMIGGHKNWINAIALLDAKTALTSSDDLSVCAWDLATGMEIGRGDFGTVGDCPRCLTRVGPNRFAVGTSSWMVYEFELKSKDESGSSLK